MTDPATLSGLADRVEASAWPDRELDAQLVVALDLRPDWCRTYGELFIDPRRELGQPVIRANSTGEKQSSGHPPIGDYPEFTASLDAALTLLPEGCATFTDWHHRAEDPPGMIVHEAYVQRISDGRTIGSADGSTLALAMAAACLRASTLPPTLDNGE